MPAEWAPRELTLMAWPAREELWGELMPQAKRDYAEVASAIAEFEPVLMVAPERASLTARVCCGKGVEVVELPLDDSWLRDNGPIFVIGADGRRGGVDFRFNGWGERFQPHDRDDALPRRLLARLGIERFEAPLVLEGGSIVVDGEGTLLATEQCLLHPNRNPQLDRADIEAALQDFLGIEKVIWLPHGLSADHDTDGHVDNVAQFVRPGVVMLQTDADPRSPDHAPLRENLERLQGATDARGRKIEVIELNLLPRAEVRGATGCVPYLNLYLSDGGVIVPVCGDDPDRDQQALRLIADAFAPREVVLVPGRTLAEGGGGVHCITQPLPLAA
jgi:agmatine deiminase